MSTDAQQIRRVVEEQVTGLRERDAKRIVARYAPDAVTYDLAPPLRHTGPEVQDPSGLDSWLAGFDGPVRYEITDLAVTVGGDVAYCTSLDRMAATPKGAPQSFSMWIRATRCLRKIDGYWRITHEHTSTPFYMDGSFRAAVDLQP